MERTKRLFAELKRRNIYKVGVVYLAIAWLLTQVVVSVEEPLNLPPSFDTIVIMLLALGFPPVLLFAWLREPAATLAAGTDAAGAPVTMPETEPADTAFLRGETRFCTTPDGYRLAYSRFGHGALPLLRTGNWISHQDAEWDSPIVRPMLRDMSREFEMITYDGRGSGLSDRNVTEFSLDSMVQDMETVVDANELERFAVLAFSQSCAVTVAYAVRHPERLTGMVLYGGFLSNFRTREEIDAIAALFAQNWGHDNPATRQLFTSALWPDGTKAELDSFNELQRQALSPEAAARLFMTSHALDVRELATRVAVPTLVIHSRDEQGVPLECSREAASLIPGARLVTLDSRNHIVLEREPAYRKFIDETVAFLKVSGSGPAG